MFNFNVNAVLQCLCSACLLLRGFIWTMNYPPCRCASSRGSGCACVRVCVRVCVWVCACGCVRACVRAFAGAAGQVLHQRGFEPRVASARWSASVQRLCQATPHCACVCACVGVCNQFGSSVHWVWCRQCIWLLMFGVVSAFGFDVARAFEVGHCILNSARVIMTYWDSTGCVRVCLRVCVCVCVCVCVKLYFPVVTWILSLHSSFSFFPIFSRNYSYHLPFSCSFFRFSCPLSLLPFMRLALRFVVSFSFLYCFPTSVSHTDAVHRGRGSRVLVSCLCLLVAFSTAVLFPFVAQVPQRSCHGPCLDASHNPKFLSVHFFIMVNSNLG